MQRVKGQKTKNSGRKRSRFDNSAPRASSITLASVDVSIYVPYVRVHTCRPWVERPQETKLWYLGLVGDMKALV